MKPEGKWDQLCQERVVWKKVKLKLWLILSLWELCESCYTLIMGFDLQINGALVIREHPEELDCGKLETSTKLRLVSHGKRLFPNCLCICGREGMEFWRTLMVHEQGRFIQWNIGPWVEASTLEQIFSQRPQSGCACLFYLLNFEMITVSRLEIDWALTLNINSLRCRIKWLLIFVYNWAIFQSKRCIRGNWGWCRSFQ